jgi:hypothetical protein
MIFLAFILIIVFIVFLRVYRIVLLEKSISNIDSFDIKSTTAVDYFITKEHNLFKFFKKTGLKLFFSSICISSMLLFTISANVSIWPNVKGLTMDDKQNSIAFRNFRGSSCINEFTALKPALETAKLNGYNSKDIIGIFGEPNSKNSEGTIFEYNLLPGTVGCKGLIILENDRVINYDIGGCN